MTQRSVPVEFTPAVFIDGVQVAFPHPTKQLKKTDRQPARSIATSWQMRQKNTKMSAH